MCCRIKKADKPFARVVKPFLLDVIVLNIPDAILALPIVKRSLGNGMLPA
jgi:hypothetical protein